MKTGHVPACSKLPFNMTGTLATPMNTRAKAPTEWYTKSQKMF